MDKALEDIGPQLSLRVLVAQTPAIIEDLIVHPNVSKIVENHHRHCKSSKF